MATELITLGQLFIRRRDIKSEIGELEGSLLSLGYHREDKTKPEEDYTTVLASLESKREFLLSLDSVIIEANSRTGSVSFGEKSMSLNEARHLKTHLGARLATFETQIRHLTSFKGRVENDFIFDITLTPPGNRQVKVSYNVLADLSSMKATALSLKKDIRLLDSLIQKADWSLTVSAPCE